MKYKKKVILEGSAVARKSCMPLSAYNLFTPARATQRAITEAENKIPKSASNGNCTWSTKAEVKDAKYSVGASGTSSNFEGLLQPGPRCTPEPEAGKGSHGGPCKTRQTINEYTPGGSRPPCQNGAEGTCVEIFPQEARWSTKHQPVGWQQEPRRPGDIPIKIYLSYKYRWVAGSITQKGSGNCPSAPGPGSWFSSEMLVTEVYGEDFGRCEDRIRHYDCCCSCPKEQLKVAELVPATSIIPGLAPCYGIQTPAQAQALIDAAYSALAIGACAVAIAFLAQATAIITATALTAGCAYQMIMINAPCSNPQGGT